MGTSEWRKQLDEVERDIQDGRRQIEATLAKIKPLQDRQARLEAIRSAIYAYLEHEGAESADSPTTKAPPLFYEIPNPSARRARFVNSPRKVMLDALRVAGRPMSPGELWEAAAAAGYTTKQAPTDAANYSMYGAKRKYNDPVERLNTGEWVWVGKA